MQNLGHRIDIMQDETIRDQMIVFDELTLLVSVVLSYRRVPTEGYPLGEPIECLAFVCCGMYDTSKLDVAEVLE